MTTVYCQMCGGEREVVGDIPPVCPNCGLLTIWTTIITTVRSDDAWPYLITSEDRQLLLKLRIASE